MRKKRLLSKEGESKTCRSMWLGSCFTFKLYTQGEEKARRRLSSSKSMFTGSKSSRVLAKFFSK